MRGHPESSARTSERLDRLDTLIGSLLDTLIACDELSDVRADLVALRDERARRAAVAAE